MDAKNIVELGKENAQSELTFRQFCQGADPFVCVIFKNKCDQEFQYIVSTIRMSQNNYQNASASHHRKFAMGERAQCSVLALFVMTLVVGHNAGNNYNKYLFASKTFCYGQRQITTHLPECLALAL